MRVRKAGQAWVVGIAASTFAAGGIALAAPPVSSIGSGWETVLADEFDGDALAAQRWSAVEGCAPYCSAGDTVAVSGGALHLSNRAATPEDDALTAWIGGEVISAETFGDGYFEVVLQAPAQPGLATAALLAPADAGAAERWEMYLAELYQPAGAPNGQWSARQRAFDWTLPTATGRTPWIGGVTPALSATTDYSAGPVTFGLYRTAAGDLGWYRSGVAMATEYLPWTAGARTDLALHLRLAAAAFAGEPLSVDGAEARVHAVRIYRPSNAPVLYEPFAYPAGTIDGLAGGTGFAGAWSVTAPVNGSATGDGLSLAYPQASPAVGAGGRLMLNGTTAQRTLGIGIKLSELNAYFCSALVQKPDAATIRFELLDSAGNIRWRMGLDAQERAIAGIVTDATGPAGVPVVNVPVAVVSLAAARAGNGEDELRTKTFGAASALPARAFDIAAFDAAQKQLSQVTLTTLRISATGGPVVVDELRFGSTLASVTTERVAYGACPAPPDYVDDDRLDLRDAAVFLAAFDAQSPAADVNADGRVDLRDYAAFMLAMSQGCP